MEGFMGDIGEKNTEELLQVTHFGIDPVAIGAMCGAFRRRTRKPAESTKRVKARECSLNPGMGIACAPAVPRAPAIGPSESSLPLATRLPRRARQSTIVKDSLRAEVMEAVDHARGTGARDQQQQDEPPHGGLAAHWES